MNTWPHWLPEDKEGVARLAHRWANAEKIDAHWHAFTPELFEQLFNVANLMSPRLFSPIMIAHPYLETANKTICDILYVFRVETRSTSAVSEELENHGGLNALRSLDEKLSKALEKLRNLLLTKPTSALDQKGVH